MAGGGLGGQRKQARDLSRLLGAQVGRGKLAMLPFDPLPSQWFRNFPLRAWDPFPSPAAPQERQSHPASTSPPSPHAPRPSRSLGVPPVPLGVRGPPPVPGMCPNCLETRILRPPSTPSSGNGFIYFFALIAFVDIPLSPLGDISYETHSF